MAKRNTLDMTQGPVLRKLLLYAYPLIISATVNQLYNVVDKAIAGKFIGSSAMAAVGASSAPIALIVNVFTGMAVGVSVSCGNYIGAGKKEDLRRCMHTAPFAGLFCGLLVCLIGLFSSRALLMSTNTPSEVFSDALTYMTIYMLGTPIQITNNFLACILNAHGDTKRITIIGISSGLLNVLGNLLFVLVIPLGVAGIALSTVLSITASLTAKLVILFNPKDNYRMTLSELRPRMQYMKEIFSVGVPAGASNIAFSLANMLMQSSINSFGTAVIAGDSAAVSLLHVITPIYAQIGNAVSCTAAQCYGAKNFPRITEAVKKGMIFSLSAVFVCCIIITLFSTPLMMLFTDDPAVADAGFPVLMFSGWGYMFFTVCHVFSGALRGLRKSTVTMVCNLAGICLPRILWILFVFPHFNTLIGLYICMPLSYGIAAIALGFSFKHTHKRLSAQ